MREAATSLESAIVEVGHGSFAAARYPRLGLVDSACIVRHSDTGRAQETVGLLTSGSRV